MALVWELLSYLTDPSRSWLRYQRTHPKLVMMGGGCLYLSTLPCQPMPNWNICTDFSRQNTVTMITPPLLWCVSGCTKIVRACEWFLGREVHVDGKVLGNLAKSCSNSSSSWYGRLGDMLETYGYFLRWLIRYVHTWWGEIRSHSEGKFLTRESEDLL